MHHGATVRRRRAGLADPVTFGGRVRELRRANGLSQRTLADAIGIDFQYLRKIETGAFGPPSEAAVGRIADVLGADREELMTIARKIPPDLQRTLLDAPVEATIIVRQLRRITPDQYKRIMKVVDG
jgi:transcriptional regulator with XRE-family HTH domain